MNKCIVVFCFVSFTLANAFAEPALTIYNQKFAVVRDTVPLDLKKGVNEIKYSEATAHLEPDSVVLRDPSGKHTLQILEQNFRGDPISEALLLSLNEGKTIDFESVTYEGNLPKKEILRGKVVRSGYVPHTAAWDRYGSDYYQTQMAYIAPSSGSSQPIVEVNGKLMFRLPGTPLFPTLPDNTILKPTLTWLLESDKPGKLDAELSYVTGGMSWVADYNVVAPENGNSLDLTGWVTIDNQSGKAFENAKIKLMAGDVSKVQRDTGLAFVTRSLGGADGRAAAAVSEKAFDEYHLYTVQRATTLLDRETKQVEFVTAHGIQSQPVYVYDGAKIDQNRYNGWSMESIRNDREYGTQSNNKVWVMREFYNSVTNHLGMPLPKGRVRFYRRDSDGQVEFTGENFIDHTPKDELIRVATGNAFDLVGERKRTNFKSDDRREWLEESFEIKLRNHKKQAAEIRVVEHLYRGANWDITEKSNAFVKTDAQTMEFRVQLGPDEDKTITYTVHYSW